MARDYVEQRDGGYYVSDTRVSLDSIVYAFRRGESAETICQNFEVLNLEEVYGAIARLHRVLKRWLVPCCVVG